MAPRAYWKGYLKLSLVSCPIALFPATSEREKISFRQLNRNTGHRIKYVDSDTGDEVEASDIIKGYEVGKGQYVELQPEELEAPIERPQEPKQSNVINLMDALRQSLKTEGGPERKKSAAPASPKRAPTKRTSRKKAS